MNDEANMTARDFAATADDATTRYFRKQLDDILSKSRQAISTDGIANISAALSKAQAAFATPKKTKTAKIQTRGGASYTYKYADLQDVLDSVRKALAANELAVVHMTQEFGGQVELVTMLTHSSGEWFKSIYPVKAHADRPQEMGSAMTYARRYTLSALLGIASEEDDDAQGAQEAAKQAGRDPALREGIERLNARQEPPQEPVGADLSIMSPETGEIVESFPRRVGGVREFMRQLESACRHSALYWKLNGAQARELAQQKPDVKVDEETLGYMVDRLEGQYGGIAEPEDPRDDPAKVMIP